MDQHPSGGVNLDPVEQLQEVNRAFQELLTGSELDYLEATFVTKDGRRVVLENIRTAEA